MGAYISTYLPWRWTADEPPTKKRKLSDGSSVPGGEIGIVDVYKDRRILHLESEIRRLQATQDGYNNLKRKYEEEKLAKDDALRRLSTIASSRLRDNNPNIADLSDQNRPTKIAEKLSELYDNQWTDAFDALSTRKSEAEIIKFLRELIMKIYDVCKDIAWKNYFEKVQRCIELPHSPQVKNIPRWTATLPDQLKQEIKEFRKSRAIHVTKEIEKTVKEHLIPQHTNLEAVRNYFSSCVAVTWLMVVQDPPLVLTTASSTKFDKNIFKEYTKRGAYVEYVVWPALSLHEGGPILAKGVAQGGHQIHKRQ